MNSACIFLLALALFGAVAQAYMGAGFRGCGPYSGHYGSGYGAAGTCGPTTSVCDTCQCVKTVVRPVIEQIPYACKRRIHAPRYTSVYPGPTVGLVERFSGPGLLETRPIYGGFNGYNGYDGFAGNMMA
ncbi:hypothetical protein RUM43_008953 [Polyplax serrata]|uniref:Uncharacterized protein n=1 Tax=Polyplax serrata TaxID=468196 RepID=A0AAN8S0V2_POLSC